MSIDTAYTANDNFTTNYTCDYAGIGNLGYINNTPGQLLLFTLYCLFAIFGFLQALVNVLLVICFWKKLGLSSIHSSLLLTASICMFMNQALWIPYNSSYFLPCESWLNTSDAATRLEASFYFLSDECFYIAYGILWYCVVYRFKLLTMGEITFTNNKVFYIPIFTMATLFLAVGVFVQAPINLYLNLNFSIFPDLLTIWSKWTYSIHQPLILFFSSIFDTVLSTLVLFQLYTHLSVFSNDNDNNRLGFKRWIIQTLKSRRTQAAVAVRILVYFFIAWISISLVLITVLVTQWICECVNQNQNSEGAGWQLQNISPYIISWVGLIEQSFSIYFLVLVKRFVKAGGPSPLNAVPLGISAVRHSISSGFLQSGINNNYSQHIYSDIEDPARP